MKKITLLFIIFSVFFTTVFAEFSIVGGKYVTATDSKIDIQPQDGVQEIYFFERATAVKINFVHTGNAGFTWYKFTNDYAVKTVMRTEAGTSTSLELEDSDFNAGYELEFNDGTPSKIIWIVDLYSFLPAINAITPYDGNNPCQQTEIEVALRNPEIYYYGKNSKYTVPRRFTLTYNTLEWDGKAYNPKEIEEEKSFPTGDITHRFSTQEAPLISTVFTLKADQFLAILGGERVFSSPEYPAVAVEAHLTGEITQRPFKNERDRDSPSSDMVAGSAPLVVEFKSNGNMPAARYFEWDVYSTDENRLLNHYVDENLQYTFNKSGVYSVKLAVFNGNPEASPNHCYATDSITVRAIESALEVPNVFTPNGDGINDEFRVAYKSIATFSGVVYNRWGRKVFEWTDPGKGWDGRIGSRMAEPGAYYYIIEAEGTDIDPETGKPVKYRHKGDINLIRGK